MNKLVGLFREIFPQINSKARLLLLVVAFVLYALIPVFQPSPYYHDLFIAVLVNATLGMMFIMGLRAGLINMGIIPFMGVGAYTTAVLSTKFEMNVWLCMLLAVLLTMVLAFIIGVLLIGSGSGGLTFVILSSVIGMLFNVIVGSIRYLGAWDGIPYIPRPDPIKIPFLPPLEFNTTEQMFYLAVFFFILVVLVSNAFYSSRIGRAWNAIGENANLARSVGVNIFRYKLLAFVVSCTICGLIGTFYAHYHRFVIPTSFDMWQNVYVQIYAILGGMGYATLGPLLGAGVMTFFPEVTRIAREVSPLFLGMILVLLILFQPEGLLGLLKYRGGLVHWIKSLGARLAGRPPGGQDIPGGKPEGS